MTVAASSQPWTGKGPAGPAWRHGILGPIGHARGVKRCAQKASKTFFVLGLKGAVPLAVSWLVPWPALENHRMKTSALPMALVAACCAAAPALALDLASSTASSASSAGSASVGSVSDSLRSSSQSSASPRQMAEGTYRVIDMAEVDGQPGQWRLTLQAQTLTAHGAPAAGFAAADASSAPQWELRLPQAVVEREGLAAGHLLRAAPQPYGVAFARAEQARPFYLVLLEEWQRELPARPVQAPGGA